MGRRHHTSIWEAMVEGPDTASNTTTQDKFEENGAAPTATAPTPAEPAAAPTAPGKRPMKHSTRVALTIIVILAVLAALGFGGAYFLYSRNFVSTDNAQVDGDKVQVNAPATGTLVDWEGQQGAQVRRDQIVGRVKLGSSGAQPQMTIKAPGNGTIAINNAVEGQWVTAGTNLATAYDFNKIYVTARVDETDVGDIHAGAQVDVDVDAFPGVPVTGIVTEIQGAAADQFSLFPESNSTGNFQKVTQVIAVRVAFTNTGGVQLVPGMNVTVHIHKQ
ncbi:MAG TPA: efflux RND transporter periplasmic adaptor subunit [Pseudonocardia sp.]|jgi:multidrug resistance efflux pump|nr:efflux RND transporter periplasmic adaptor subunit [Pseudonocardia sp.]